MTHSYYSASNETGRRANLLSHKAGQLAANSDVINIPNRTIAGAKETLPELDKSQPQNYWRRNYFIEKNCRCGNR